MQTLVLVYGCRPEVVKLGVCVAELKALGIQPHLLCTGQHTSLLQGTPAETDLAGATSLGLKSDGQVLRWLAQAERPLEKALADLGDCLVVVQGDTMSALAGARAAHTLALPLVHVEAGVRSGTLQEPWPEEGFRREITSLATWHYAATSHAAGNLRRDKVPVSRVKLTGNPIVSAIARYSDARPQPAVLPHQVLITLHRRELLLSPWLLRTLQSLAFAIAHFEEIQFLWPVHPAMEPSVQQITWPPNVTFTGPLPYRICIEGLARCFGVLTDSGGLQEEAATLGVPCSVLRRVTDRPESVESGLAKVFPPYPENMLPAIGSLKLLPRKANTTFGTPSAASLIAKHLASLVENHSHQRRSLAEGNEA